MHRIYRSRRSLLLALPLALTVCLPLFSQAPSPQGPPQGPAQGPPAFHPERKKLLAYVNTQKGFTHDSIGHAVSVIERLGYESKLYDTYIRSDSQWISKQPIPAPARNARNLNYFDAVFVFISDEGDLTPEQKRDLESFVKDDGKGIVAAHTGIAAFYSWPEWGDMIGGYFDNHPWNQVEAKVVVEAPDFPAFAHFPKTFTRKEEFYVLREKPFSRDNVRVLAHIDPASVDLKNPNLRRKVDTDFPVALARQYGKGRTFWSVFGHTPETWDDAAIQTMYLNAIKWAMGLTEGDATPRPAARTP
jgi:type 1 glutamine amidotransferase